MSDEPITPEGASPALLLATVALFVALGGGAYAGVALNEVRSANIKNGEVKTSISPTPP